MRIEKFKYSLFNTQRVSFYYLVTFMTKVISNRKFRSLNHGPYYESTAYKKIAETGKCICWIFQIMGEKQIPA